MANRWYFWLIIIVYISNVLGCSSFEVRESNSKEQHVRLLDKGQCTYLHDIEKDVCLEIRELDDGLVYTRLYQKESGAKLISSTTYLTPAYAIFSPSGRYLGFVESQEGHASYSFYAAKQLIDPTTKLSPLTILDDPNLAHIDLINDNGDVVYALTEGTFNSCSRYETEFIDGRPKHTERCVVGFNIETQRSIEIALPFRCRL